MKRYKVRENIHLFEVGMKIKIVASMSDFLQKISGKTYIIGEVNLTDKSLLTKESYWYLQDTIVEILTNPDGTPWVDPEYPITDEVWKGLQQVLKTTATFIPGYHPLFNPYESKAQKKTFMTMLKNFYKEKTRTEPEKTLIKHGLETEDGDMTRDARDYALDLIVEAKWKEIRTEVAKDLKAADDEENN